MLRLADGILTRINASLLQGIGKLPRLPIDASSGQNLQVTVPVIGGTVPWRRVALVGSVGAEGLGGRLSSV